MIAEVIFNCHNAEKVATFNLTVFPGRIFCLSLLTTATGHFFQIFVVLANV